MSLDSRAVVTVADLKSRTKKGAVATFMAERLTRTEGARLSPEDLFHAYHVWCRQKGLAPQDHKAFAERLAAICDTAGIARSKKQSLLNVALN